MWLHSFGRTSVVALKYMCSDVQEGGMHMKCCILSIALARSWIICHLCDSGSKELGIDFTLANNMSMAEAGHFEKVCEQYGIKMIHIDFDRNPLGKSNLLARKQLLELMEKEKYDIVHCNTPSGGMVGRIAAAQMKIPKVIYMAHGFHFWKGAPLKNWCFYYPVERTLPTSQIAWLRSIMKIAASKAFSLQEGRTCWICTGRRHRDKTIRAWWKSPLEMRNTLGIKDN